MDKCYCPMCGKRVEQPQHTRTYETPQGTATVNFYVTNHTEPICTGRHAPREPVPQAFYDAFKDEEER